MADDGREWSRAWTARVGRAVKASRTRRGLSQQELADATADLGYLVSRNTVMNIEGGRAESVTLQQIAALAAALGEAPVELAFSIDDDSEVDLLPGLKTEAFHAAEWFSGRAWLDPTNNDAEGVEVPAPLLAHWRLHDDLFAELLALQDSAMWLPGDPPEKRAELNRRIAEQERLIQVFRAGMRNSGLKTPRLFDDYSYLDAPMPRAARPLGRGVTTTQGWLDGEHQEEV